MQELLCIKLSSGPRWSQQSYAAKSYTYLGHTTYSQGTGTCSPEQSNSITVVASHSTCQNHIFPPGMFLFLLLKGNVWFFINTIFHMQFAICYPYKADDDKLPYCCTVNILTFLKQCFYVFHFFAWFYCTRIHCFVLSHVHTYQNNPLSPLSSSASFQEYLRPNGSTVNDSTRCSSYSRPIGGAWKSPKTEKKRRSMRIKLERCKQTDNRRRNRKQQE